MSVTSQNRILIVSLRCQKWSSLMENRNACALCVCGASLCVEHFQVLLLMNYLHSTST